MTDDELAANLQENIDYLNEKLARKELGPELRTLLEDLLEMRRTHQALADKLIPRLAAVVRRYEGKFDDLKPADFHKPN
jgi:hypothetical protein